MKRKIKRQVQKKWKAFLLPLGLITTLVIFIYNSLKDSILPELVIKIRSLLVLDEKSIWPILIILIFLIVIILSISSIITRLILFYNKPDAKYFQLVDFEKPTHKTIKKAVEGILNSEKTKPYFIHAAPINDEIEQFYEKLDNDSFVWENGKPGDGKSMLAYQALYRYRKIVSFTYGFISIKLFKRKYRVYELKKDEIADVKEILAILDELYSLKGGRRIIILVDDAHKLSFEDKLRREFEKEAKDAISGKFVWISTNYLTGKQEETNDSINISFEKFYPKLLNEFYGSQHPIIKDVIKNKCKNLHEAKELTTEKGRIKDPWHFNFIATNGEKRISELLLKLSPDNNKQDTLLLSIFLFSCRNIITGEKEIHQREFIKLLTSIEDPNFKKDIEIYQPSNIISDLASTDKGRFLIIENKNSLNRGFLRAPHFRLSIAIIKSVIANFSENSIKPMINASKLLFTENFVDSKYFGIYFNALGVYQDFFLRENNDWVKKFLNNIILDQLHVYPYLLYVLKNYHRSFYMDLITDGYLNSIASQISVAPTSRFSSIQNLIKVLGNDKENLVKYLNWETLAKAANKAEVAHFGQLEAILNALGNDKENLVKYLNWETLANAVNNSEAAQLKQVADFINALGSDKADLVRFLKWETLAKAANKAEVAHFGQLEAILNALGNDKENLVKYLNWETLANAVNNSEAAQLKQVADFINALGSDKADLVKFLKWETLAKAANKAEVAQLTQVADFINALENDKENLVKYLNWETLAKAANKAEVAQLKQVADFINALGDDKKNLVKYLNWETLAKAANKAEVAQLAQVADFINALGNDKENLSMYLKEESIITFSENITWKQISSFCIILASIETERRNSVISKCDWVFLLNKINLNHSAQIKSLSYILNYQNKKQAILNLTLKNELLNTYLVKNKDEIVRFSTQFFIIPNDFQSCSNLITALIPHSSELCQNIVDKTKYKIIKEFNISPRYYKSFSNLLNTIYQINPLASKYIITNNLVKSALFVSFKDEGINEQLVGLQSLLDSIKNIDPLGITEITSLQCIKDLGLKDIRDN